MVPPEARGSVVETWNHMGLRFCVTPCPTPHTPEAQLRGPTVCVLNMRAAALMPYPGGRPPATSPSALDEGELGLFASTARSAR